VFEKRPMRTSSMQKKRTDFVKRELSTKIRGYHVSLSVCCPLSVLGGDNALYIFSNIYVYINNISISTYIYMNKYVFVYKYLRLHLHVCVCVYIFIYIYIPFEHVSDRCSSDTL